MLSRAVMALAMCWLGDRRSIWAQAMRAEYEVALADGTPLRFAAGCLVAAWREMLTSQHGHLTLTSYGLVLGLMLPMAALQIGCALFGLPYLFPDQKGLAGALLNAGDYERHLRGVYQAAIPSFALLQLLLAFAQLRIAWVMLLGDWARVARLAWLTLAAAATLAAFLAVLFLDSSQMLRQAGVLLLELAAVMLVARCHGQITPAAEPAYPG